MDYWFLLPVLLLSTNTGILYTHPTPANALQFEPGISYKYNYQFTVLLNEDSNITSRSASVGRDVGYMVSTEFLITSIWQNPTNSKENLLKLEILKPMLHVSSSLHDTANEMRHWSKLDDMTYPPAYIHWSGGLIKSVYFLPDIESMVNIKKGIASLFQLRVVDGVTKELDTSGLCRVSYKAEGKAVKKNKTNCSTTSTKEKQLSSNKLRSSASSTYIELLYNLNPEGVISAVSGTEEVMINLNMWTQAAVYIKSKTRLILINCRNVFGQMS